MLRNFIWASGYVLKKHDYIADQFIYNVIVVSITTTKRMGFLSRGRRTLVSFKENEAYQIKCCVKI